MFSLLLTAALAVLIPPVHPGTPNRQPFLSSEAGETALVFGSGTTIWYARSTDQGQSFSTPLQIADVPALMLGRHRGPRVAVNGKTVVVTAISGGDSGSLLAWRSEDRGATWSKQPVTVNDEPHAAREGLQNLAVTKEGVLGVVWLDLRAKGTRLYGSYSRDGGKTWAKNEPLYVVEGGTICTCCHPSITANSEKFAVMFRNVRDGNRDMYTFDWLPGRKPSSVAKQGDQSWNLNACPMDGGGLVVENGQLVTAWRRDHKVFLALGKNSEQELGDGKDVALTASRKGPVVAWVSPAGSIMVSMPGSKEATKLADTGGFPVLNSAGGEVVAAWENGDAIALQSLKP